MAISFQQNVVDCIIYHFINTLFSKFEKVRKTRGPGKNKS